MHSNFTSLAQSWSGKLGLALSSLFGNEDRQFGGGEHFALLDGVTASFSMSLAEEDPPSSQTPSEWAWSANLRKHVWVANDSRVHVSTVARPNQVEHYSLTEVSSNLERFLEYLSSDRQSPKTTVMDHVLMSLDNYRQLARSRFSAADEAPIATRALLFRIAQEISPGMELDDLARKYAIGTEHQDCAQWLLQQSVGRGAGGGDFSLHAGVAVRHAGGAIFQRATAQLTLAPQYDLFSGTQSAQFGVATSLRHGGYFTPPGLARSLAEAAILGKIDRPRLRICDPACGSGVFLAEVLRALQRARYSGTVELVGRDILSFAVEIATFVTKCGALDFGEDRVAIDIQRGNTLENPPPGPFDIILMNPPFRSWEQSTPEDKDSVKRHLEGVFRGKPDFSLAFANLAFGLLGEGGTLATLLPSGVLTAEYSQPWRSRICDESVVSLVGTLGDHYIFDYAMVNIATLVIHRKRPLDTLAQKTLMLWANEDPKASSVALRNLRKGQYSQPSSDNAGTWRTYSMPQLELARRINWIPSASGNEEIIEFLRMRQFPRLKELFRVHQGIRTGAREVFVLSNTQWIELPKAERIAFRPIVEKDGISRFSIDSSSHVFYAGVLQNPIENEDDFRLRFPFFYEHYVEPNLGILRARPRGVPIWQLSWPRTWLKKIEPRIVSRMFVGRRQFGFAVDGHGDRAVVQGYGWVPNWKAIAAGASREERLLILNAYSFLFSSDLFFSLVQSVSVNIAGGQYDLAPKFIDDLPIPDWPTIKGVAESTFSSLDKVRELASIYVSNPTELEKFARAAFGVDRSPL